MQRLTPENYGKGFLIDNDLMAGVTENSEGNGKFTAFVLQYATGEYLGYRPFDALDEALSAINSIPRDWIYEAAGGCGGCKDGSCGKGACTKTLSGEGCRTGTCPAPS